MAKITDPALVPVLARQKVDLDQVGLLQDYASRTSGKNRSPYARTYCHKVSGQRYLVSSGLPMVDAYGQSHDLTWQEKNGSIVSGNNIFRAVYKDGETTLTTLSDQPSGAKEGDQVKYRPQFSIGGTEVKPASAFPKLLEVDPVNGEYGNNVLEWDYGICRRRLRLIEGKILGSWVFTSKPAGDVVIRYNQEGRLRLRLQYANGDDEELIPLSYFDNLLGGWPVTISDSATFYPDADPETSSVDGRVLYNTGFPGPGVPWSTVWGAASGMSVTDSDDLLIVQLTTGTTTNYWVSFWRSILLFDTSALGPGTVISSAVLSLYGSALGDNGSGWTEYCNIYGSNPTSNTGLVLGDYSKVQAVAFCDTPIVFGSFHLGTPGTSNDFVLNGPGLSAINENGVSKFSFRDTRDAENSPPSWIDSKYASLQAWASDKGAGYKPKLVVIYAAGGPYPIIGGYHIIRTEGGDV